MTNISYKKYYRDKEYIESEKLFRNIFLKRYKIINKYVSSKGKVLDIGSANGVFLDICKDYGWQTYGVEPSSSGKIAEEKGHNIKHEYFEETTFPKDYFDLVIMNHTLEHVKDADLVLRKIYGILKNGGILYIDVPNAGGLGSKVLKNKWKYRLPDEHNYQFTKKSLSLAILSTGFNILHWESRSGLFEFASPHKELWQSLSGRKKRFFTDLSGLPYAALVTLIRMGDSMSVIAKKL